MALHPKIRPMPSVAAPRPRDAARIARLERDLEEASSLLWRLLDAEDRIGLAYPVMDDARRFLSRRAGGSAVSRVIVTG